MPRVTAYGKFKPGNKVVCIDDTNYNNTYNETCPVRGNIYTVRDTSGNCLRLREIVNARQQYVEGTMECLFNQARFDSQKPGGGKP